MAIVFDTNNNDNNSNSGNGSAPKYDALAFVNAYLPTSDGKELKVGYLALKKGTNGVEELVAHLKENPDQIEKFLKALRLDFKFADGSSRKPVTFVF